MVVAGASPRPLARDEDENSADGDQPVLEGVHGQDGELGSILQRKDSKQPPAPGRTAGTGLWGENTHVKILVAMQSIMWHHFGLQITHL